VASFLDYWLDLRKVNNTSPDELSYCDYYWYADHPVSRQRTAVEIPTVSSVSCCGGICRD
jgi:hypothetical protein